jgi:hypothetical protein
MFVKGLIKLNKIKNIVGAKAPSFYKYTDYFGK